MSSLADRIRKMEIIYQAPDLWCGYGSKEAMHAAAREAMARGDQWFVPWDHALPPYVFLADELAHEEFERESERYDRLWPRTDWVWHYAHPSAEESA